MSVWSRDVNEIVIPRWLKVGFAIVTGILIVLAFALPSNHDKNTATPAQAAPAPEPVRLLPNGDTPQTSYDQCKAWAKQGYNQTNVQDLIGTYVAGNHFTPREQDAVLTACARGFVAGGGA